MDAERAYRAWAWPRDGVGGPGRSPRRRRNHTEQRLPRLGAERPARAAAAESTPIPAAGRRASYSSIGGDPPAAAAADTFPRQPGYEAPETRGRKGWVD